MTSDDRLIDDAVALPVAECLGDLIALLQASRPVVLKAPPGAGKTTGVPPVLLDEGIGKEGQMLLVQPRRLAARAAASRLASLRGTRLGTEVGYHVRFDKCFNRRTKLVAITTGVLLRRLSADPLLEDASCVLLDEFHERSVDVDLALGMLQRIRTTLRPELKLVVMSATLDPQPIVDFLGDATALESKGRSFPVTVEYTDVVSRDDVDRQVAAVLPDVLRRSSGHVLVFLPGVGEIRRVHRTLAQRGLTQDALVLELYGDLPPEQQDAVLNHSVQRKIILSTNVAETSVTIHGVGAVIDTGTARVMQHDVRVGLPKLQLEPISQASADQRAGRAGRTQAGLCVRLWPPGLHRSRRTTDLPEVSRCDLSPAVLTLASWGERDVSSFPWITAPPVEAIANSRLLLQRLDAIDEDGSVTELGSLMNALPLPPRLARFMIEAARLGVEEEASTAAAMLSERDPFRGVESVASDSVTACDVWDRLERFKESSRGADSSTTNSALINSSARRRIRQAAKQILRETRSLKMDNDPAPNAAGGLSKATRLKRSLLAAFPDRLAKRREPMGDRGVMVGGRGVRLDRRSQARTGEMFLCIDVDAKGVEATVRIASSIELAWLDPRHLRDVNEPYFDHALKSVVARRRHYLQDLLLSESPIRCEPSREVADLLAEEARPDLSRVMPGKDGPLTDFIHQVRFLERQMPEFSLPSLNEEAIDEVLVLLCQNRTSFAELAAAPWLDHLRGRYDYEQLRWIDRHAPSRLTVPSGNSIAIRYAEGKPPSMEVRIQEVFGWKETPRIAGGNVVVQMHLLGPNYRPQQITDDLASFWRETYSHVRKELRRRYPKHHWPEDPTSATATRNGLKPRT